MSRVSESFDEPIPTGCQIYESRLFVQGFHIEPYRTNGARFARGRKQRLELQGEPSNPKDPNAIVITGIFKGFLLSSKAQLGYVPREVAEGLVQAGLLQMVSARLKYVSLSPKGRIVVEFDIVGPKANRSEYLGYFETKQAEGPPSDEQKEFAWFLGSKLSKGTTYKEAEAQLRTAREQLYAQDSAKAQEWEAYWRICEELDDAENRKDFYGIKSIRRSILREAVSDLRQSGVAIADLAANPQMVVDKILEQRPELEYLP